MDTEHTQDPSEFGIQQFRIERGAQVLGPDGMLGTVEQIIVDRASGKVQSLVIQGEDNTRFELPANTIERATGDEVHLAIGRADLAAQPELARPYSPERYSAVDEGTVVLPSEVARMEPDTPMLTDIEADAVEIAAPSPSRDQLDVNASAFGVADEVGDIADQDTVILGAPAATPPVTPSPLAADVPGDEIEIEIDADDLEPDEAVHLIVTGERPLASHDDMRRGGPGGIAVLAATGVLVGAVTAAGVAYLMLRRRDRAAPLSLAATRARLGKLRGAATSAWETVRATGSDQLPALGAQARRASSRTQDWLIPLGLAVGAWWQRGRDRAAATSTQWRAQAGRAADATTGALPSPSAIRAAVVTTRAGLSARGQRLTRRFATSAAEARRQMARKAPRRHAEAAATVTSKPTANAARAKTARRASARGARRFGRRVRWFRRGVFVGAAWGLLYAPAPGRESRDRIAQGLRHIPGATALLERITTASPTVGGTGPHAGAPDLTERAAHGAVAMRTPPPELTSEEPLASSPESDAPLGEVTDAIGR